MLASLTVLAIFVEASGAEIDMFHPPSGAKPAVAWTFFCEDSAATQSDTWEIGAEVIVCKGTPLGYLRTEQDFTDFVLRLEWRRPEGKKPGRGGVLVRTTGKDKIWPKSLEAQLNAGGAGDFWGLDGYRLSGPEARFKQLDNEQFGRLTNVQKTEDAENPPGTWNRYEIIADGDVVTIKINGREVNRATRCDVVPGKICLTAEGDEIHFRNVRITPKDN
jgi:hypothetical protein